mgnify:CR=1 FL=1
MDILTEIENLYDLQIKTSISPLTSISNSKIIQTAKPRSKYKTKKEVKNNDHE